MELILENQETWREENSDLKESSLEIMKKRYETRQMSLVDQDLRTIPEHMSSPPVLIDVSVAQSLGLCVVFCRSLFILFHLIIVV
jgi:hypothetical protein